MYQIFQADGKYYRKSQACRVLNYNGYNLILDAYTKLITNEMGYGRILLFLHCTVSMSHKI